MFSGIIQSIGTIEKIQKNGSVILRVNLDEKIADISLGTSIAVNGVCLTVSKKSKQTVVFHIMEETAKKTTLTGLKKGDTVNIERSLRVGDEIGGHFVYGHIDAVGQLSRITYHASQTKITIKPPRAVMRYIVPRGAIAIDGVSLTVASVGSDTFTVSLVDYTQIHTTLGNKQKGERVNIECDMLAKYYSNSKQKKQHKK